MQSIPDLPVICTVRVIYAFMAREEGDLSLNKGDIIRVHDNDGGWWKGSLLPGLVFGSFPSNFVEIIEEASLDAGVLLPSKPLFSQSNQQSSRPHSRQSSVDSSKFTKRKPVSSMVISNGSVNASLAPTQRRKNPQAIIGDMTDIEDTALSPTSPSAASGSVASATSITGAISTTPKQQQQQQQHSRQNSNNSQVSVAASSRLGQFTSQISQLLGSPAASRGLFAVSNEKPELQTTKASTSAESPVDLAVSTSTKSMPGAFPDGEGTSANPTMEPVQVSNEAVYNPAYADRRKSASAVVAGNKPMNPSRPGVTTGHKKGSSNALSPNVGGGRNVGNRYSMPNLFGDAAAVRPPQKQQLDDDDEVGISGKNVTQAEDPQQPGMMPRSNTPTNYYSQQFMPVQQTHYQQLGANYTNCGSNHQQEYHELRGYRHSIANLGAQPHVGHSQLQQQHLQHQQQLQDFYGQRYPIPRSDLSLENLARHNRSQSSLDPVKSQNRQNDQYPPHHPGAADSSHGRSLSQVNLRREESVNFNPYDHQAQRQSRQKVSGHHTAPLCRMQPLGGRAPSPSSIIIPQPRPQSSLATFGQSFVTSPTESDVTGSMLASPPLLSGSSTGDTPTSAGTSMSATSASYSQQPPRGDRRPKSNTARMPVIASMTASNFTTRKFSVDVQGLLSSNRNESAVELSNHQHGQFGHGSSVTMANISSFQMNGADPDKTPDQEEDLSELGTYAAKKPKTTLVRALKQIMNPRKVAEKDAIKNKNEHFAWIEMQKSLKRVNSPEPGKERAAFLNGATAPTSPIENDKVNGTVPDQDPFIVLLRCQVIKDPVTAATTTGNTNSLLDFGPNTFTQVDKVARNVNQRGPHMTPQLLSQKYLTRPYSKAPLSKLRVLFVWVSENIRLEGGPTRDVSGGRYKLGPAGDHMSTLSAAATAADLSSPNLHRSFGSCATSSILTPTSSVGSPIQYSDPAFTTGMEEFARGFLQDDAPELAQEVLTSRSSKTGEGFANLFAEMALAAGIEDIGVVKGFIKGPMDVFSREIPPANHAWNVVRIEGQYRFIDCCLASPFHPAHYPNRPQHAASFYFLSSPIDFVQSHFPTFLTYQYISPSIPPQVFLKMPFVRPAFFELGMSLVDFKRRSRLDIKDDENVEVVIRIDGCGGGHNSGRHGSLGAFGDASSARGNGSNMPGTANGGFQGVYGGECVGLGCGEGVELRAEVEAMTAEGKVVRKRALAQVMIWNPYSQVQFQQHPGAPGAGSAMLVSRASMSLGVGVVLGGRGQSTMQSHHCSGVRIAKIKAVLPPETVLGPNGVRKGVVHIYAGRKVENAPSDATPYSLALSLPIQHTGTMPKTPFNFVLPHFSPYEFYVKAPQSELLYYPHTYRFCVLSLSAQAQAAAASATAVSMAMVEKDSGNGNGPSSTVASMSPTGPTHSALAGIGMVGSLSMAPVYHNSLYHTIRRSSSSTPAPLPLGATSASASSSTLGRSSPYSMQSSGRHQQQYHQNMKSSISIASTSSLGVHNARGAAVAASNSVTSILSLSSSNNGNHNNSLGLTFAVPRPERLVLRTQTNRLYKLVYDPVRQCHEAQVEVKERGIWECVRMDDGGKSRVAREGTGGVVIASWKCV
ncbi:cytokinesis protein 3 [Gryganskiella cystojenkinii]|nr:cytokinesis protein 3 [Gryganskiella cystojenkinii]